MARGTTTTLADEARTILAAQNGDEAAMASLIDHHADQIGALVRKHCFNDSTRDDLRQAAVIGFMAAVRKYDPTRGVRLRSYAETSILWEINEARRNFQALSLPYDAQKDYETAMRQARRVLGAEAGATDVYETARTLAHTAGMTPETFAAVHSARRHWTGSDVVATDVAHLVPLGVQPVATVAAVEDRDEAVRLLARLEPLARQVVALAVGYDGGEPLSDAAVAERLGMTRPTVQRIRTRALAALRAA